MSRVKNGLTPLTERVVMDLQSRAAGRGRIFGVHEPRSGSGNTFDRKSNPDSFPSSSIRESDFLVHQLRKLIPDFTPRQLAVSLNSIARGQLFDKSNRRYFVHAICERLSQSCSSLTLKDYALVLNALGKLGIKNEVFLTNAIGVIGRKISGMKISRNINIAPVSLILDAYTRLGFYGDGQVIDSCVGVVREHPDKVGSIDAITILRAISRLPQSMVPRDLVPDLISKLSSVDHVIHGLSSLSRMDCTWDELLVGSMVSRIEVSGLSVFQSIQFLNALSVLSPRNAKEVVSHVCGRLDELGDTSDPAGAVVLVISALTRLNENISKDFLVGIISKLADLPFLDSNGICLVVNLSSSVNLPLTVDLRKRVKDAMISGDSQSMSVLIHSLSKLEEVELLIELLHLPTDVKTLCRGMTDQGRSMALLSVSWLLDVMHACKMPVSHHVARWRDELVPLVIPGNCRESQSQYQLIQTIGKSNGWSQMDGLRKADLPRSPSVISSFHRDVLACLQNVVGSEQCSTNFIDSHTGYEIDIRLR
jgi:hypothetical protein